MSIKDYLRFKPSDMINGYHEWSNGLKGWVLAAQSHYCILKININDCYANKQKVLDGDMLRDRGFEKHPRLFLLWFSKELGYLYDKKYS